MLTDFFLICFIYFMDWSLETYLFLHWFYSSVFDLFYGSIIRYISSCSLVFIILCFIYLICGSLETYLYVHWYLILYDWFISWLDHIKVICFFTDFYSSVFDLVDGYIIINIFFCSLVLYLPCCRDFMGGSLNTYLFVHILFLFRVDLFDGWTIRILFICKFCF